MAKTKSWPYILLAVCCVSGTAIRILDKIYNIVPFQGFFRFSVFIILLFLGGSALKEQGGNSSSEAVPTDKTYKMCVWGARFSAILYVLTIVFLR